MSTRIVATCLVVALLMSSAAHAQDQDRMDLWHSYAEKLPPHTLVVVHLKSGKSVRGHLVQVTDERLVMLRKTRLPLPPSEFALADVESIEPQKEQMSPGAKVLGGVASTLGALTLIGILIAARLD
jgi:hypothetical protein